MSIIEQIKAEIERRITDNTFGAKLELIDILAWLDTLEEPVSVPLTDVSVPVQDVSVPPACEELNEAAKAYTDARDWAKENYLTPYIRQAFKAGANWQKSQMMKEAVEGTVHNFSSYKPHPTVLVDARGFNQGDKVRVIICKKED